MKNKIYPCSVVRFLCFMIGESSVELLYFLGLTYKVSLEVPPASECLGLHYLKQLKQFLFIVKLSHWDPVQIKE